MGQGVRGRRVVRPRAQLAAIGWTAGSFALAGVTGWALATGQSVLVGFLALVYAVLAVLAVRADALAVLAFPAAFATQRIGGGAVDLSGSDAVIIAATALILPSLVGRPLPRAVGLLLLVLAGYLVVVLVTVTFHPSPRSLVEVFHRSMMVGGSLLIGHEVVRRGHAALALRLLLAVSLTIAVSTLVVSVGNGFAIAQPFGLQKNYIGSLLATVLLVGLSAYPAFELDNRWRVPMLCLLALGLLAAHSRGAVLAVLAGLLIMAVRSRSRHRTVVRIAVVVASAGLAVFLGHSIAAQYELRQTSGNSLDSLSQRTNVEEATRRLWAEHPVTGVGLKYFRTGLYGKADQAANNVVDEALAETGLVGTAGFIVFAVGSLTVLAKASGPYATAALVVVAARFVHGQVDIFWTSGTAALPWLIAGMAISTPAVSARARRPSPPSWSPAT